MPWEEFFQVRFKLNCYPPNLLVSSLAGSIQNIPYLQYLDLSRNLLIGNIPQEMINMQSLSVLYLNHNNLRGPIPPFGSNSTSLAHLFLGKLILSAVRAYINSLIGNNQLTGGIPSSIRSLTSLQEFDLSTNHLTGPVPDWLADLALMSLWIDTNNFSGQLPLRLCQSLIICSAAFNPHLMCASMSCTCGAMLSCNCNFLCQTDANCVANNGMCSRCVGATPFLNGYCKQ